MKTFITHILLVALLLTAPTSFAQSVNLDTLFTQDSFKHKTCNQVLNSLKENFKQYNFVKGIYNFNENNFSLTLNSGNHCCTFSAKPSSHFKLENLNINKIDFDFIPNIRTAITRFNSFKIIPNNEGGFNIIQHYWLRNNQTVDLTYTFSHKKIENPIIDFSNDFDYYKEAKLIKVQVSTLCPPPNITGIDLKILSKLSYPDSLSKIGNKKMAIKYYKRIAKKYKSELSPYTDVHFKLYSLYEDNKDNVGQLNEIEYILIESLDGGKGYYMQRTCQLLLYNNQFRKLCTAYQNVINSKFTGPHQKFLSTLYYYLSQIIADKNSTQTRKELLESLSYIGFKGNDFKFADLIEWMNSINLDKNKKKEVLDIINAALSK